MLEAQRARNRRLRQEQPEESERVVLAAADDAVRAAVRAVDELPGRRPRRGVRCFGAAAAVAAAAPCVECIATTRASDAATGAPKVLPGAPRGRYYWRMHRALARHATWERSQPMAYVITEACIDEVTQDCIGVCPVDCIHFDEDLDRKLYI